MSRYFVAKLAAGSISQIELVPKSPSAAAKSPIAADSSLS
jgi:hypothetical protein